MSCAHGALGISDSHSYHHPLPPPHSLFFSIQAQRPPRPRHREEVLQRRNERQDLRVRPGRGRVHHPVGLRGRQRPLYGAPHPHLGVQDGVGKEDHGGDPVLSVCEERQEGEEPRADYGEAGGEYVDRGGVRPCHYHGPPCESDTGVL